MSKPRRALAGHLRPLAVLLPLAAAAPSGLHAWQLNQANLALTRAMVLSGPGSELEAVAALYTRALGSSARLYAGLAEAHLASSRAPEAGAALVEALQREPSQALVVYRLSRLYASAGRQAELEQRWRQSGVPARTLLHVANLTLRDRPIDAAALQVALRATAVAEGLGLHTSALYATRASLLLENRQPEAGLRAYLQALRVDRDWHYRGQAAQAVQALAGVARETGDVATERAALTFLTNTRSARLMGRLDRRAGGAHLRLAELALADGDTGAALEHADSASRSHVLTARQRRQLEALLARLGVQ